MQVDVAVSGAECLMLTRERYYDVILMDYLMPKLNGVETFHELRKQPGGMCWESAVFILTANLQSGAKQLCQENGFDGYMEKPLYGQTLEREILRFLPKEIVEYTSGQWENDGAVTYDGIVKKRKKVYITSDCVSDMSRELSDRYDVKIMYFYIQTRMGRFKDTMEIDSDSLDLYPGIGAAPATAISPDVKAYEEFFAEALTEAEEVIHISMAQYAGTAYRAAEEAARGFAHVHVVDSGQISGGEAVMVLKAARMAMEGSPAKSILESIAQDKRKVRCAIFIPSSEYYLRQGNRMLPFTRVIASVGLHLEITVRESRARVEYFYAGSLEASWARFVRRALRRSAKIDPEVVYITYVGLDVAQREYLQQLLKEKMGFRYVFMQKASFSTAANGGPGSITVSFREK